MPQVTQANESSRIRPFTKGNLLLCFQFSEVEASDPQTLFTGIKQTMKTPLNQNCVNTGCRMVTFAGWEMPIQFSGLIQEHQAVRSKAGVFDISHMGVVRLDGKNPKDALQTLVPSDLHRIGPGEACYTVLLNENGGIIDDLIIYDLGPNMKSKGNESLLIIINAACELNDIHWLKKHLEPKNITISDAKENKVLIAVQGPSSNQILQNYFEEPLINIPTFGHRHINIQNIPLEKASPRTFLSRTGYTGEDGFELLLQAEVGKQLWNQLLADGVTPCGLGARDTLRLEAGLHLYGNDMGSKTTPFEAGLGWLVHLEMQSNFIGREALEKQAKEGVQKRLVGLNTEGRAIARHGYPIFDHDEKVGEVTSGTWSPTLKKAIALGYVPTELAKIGNILNIEVRDQKHPAKVVKKPFYKKGLCS